MMQEGTCEGAGERRRGAGVEAWEDNNTWVMED